VKIEADSNDVAEHPHDDKLRPHVFMVCDKRFATKDRWIAHEEKCTQETCFSCTQCKKIFRSQHSLSVHVHSSKYKCIECGKCFQSKRNLALHRQRRSGEKPFECTV